VITLTSDEAVEQALAAVNIPRDSISSALQLTKMYFVFFLLSFYKCTGSYVFLVRKLGKAMLTGLRLGEISTREFCFPLQTQELSKLKAQAVKTPLRPRTTMSKGGLCSLPSKSIRPTKIALACTTHFNQQTN
jgi:hypothetical protein